MGKYIVNSFGDQGSDMHLNFWPFLRCPYAGDNYQTQLVPLSIASGLQFPLHYQRFTLYTFTFVDSISQEMLSGLVRWCIGCLAPS